MWLLALLCAIIGFVTALVDAGEIEVMAPMQWFVLGILLALIQPGPIPFVRRRSE